MSTSTTSQSVISTSLERSEVRDALTANGFTPNDVERLQKQLAYRKGYNLRPEVKERRKVYTAGRNARMKTLKQLLANVVG